jgi:hypothetical protein
MNGRTSLDPYGEGGQDDLTVWQHDVREVGFMRKLMATASVMVMLSGGAVATIAETTVPTSTGAVVCASPINPTINYIVQTVCSKFGP